jgi:hypothetical protein
MQAQPRITLADAGEPVPYHTRALPLLTGIVEKAVEKSVEPGARRRQRWLASP